MELMMDSSRVKEYNSMSQGRSDVVVIQEGIDTSALESAYGIPGEAKIIQSLNRPPLFRRNLEMKSLIYARPIEGARETYIAVSRSVWEDAAGTPKASNDTLRSEILLGVNLVRPFDGPNGEQHCELTTITHANTGEAVPSMLAKKIAPAQAVSFIKAIQALF
jgi:hypothetical protein